MHYQNPFGGVPLTQHVDLLLGKSYYIVKSVYQALESIKNVSDHVTTIIDISKHLDEITSLNNNESIKFFYKHWETIENLEDNLLNIKEVGVNLPSIKEIEANLPNIISVISIKDAINTNANNIEQIKNAKEYADSAKASKDASKKHEDKCQKIVDSVDKYLTDFPHIVKSLAEVEAYPHDGFFAIGGYGDPGQQRQDISNRVVKASSSTELRTLGERFTDVVNVKDYGAIGDGKIDDTQSFIAASKAKKPVWVPGGKYLVTGHVEGTFYAESGTVSIVGGPTVVRSESPKDYRKEVLFIGKGTLPVFSFVSERWGAGAKVSVQGLAVDEDWNFYVTCAVDNKQQNASDKLFIVLKFNERFEYVGATCFESEKYVEQIVVGEGKLIYAGSTSELFEHDLSSVTWSNDVHLAETCTKRKLLLNGFDNDFQLYEHAGKFYNSCRSKFAGSQAESVRRDYIFAFDKDTLTPAGVVKFDFSDVGWGGALSTANTATRKAYPKRQSFCVTDTEIIFASGAYWSSSFPDGEGYRRQGIKTFTKKGELKKTLLLDPRRFRTKLQSVGIQAQYVEIESICERDGQVFSLVATGEGDRFVVFREFSDSASAIDFSDCKSEEVMAKQDSVLFQFGGLPVNPLTGEALGTLAEVLVFMRDTATQELAFTVFSSDFDVTPLGVTQTTTSIRIRSRYGSAYLIDYMTSDKQGVGAAYAVLSASDTVSITPVSVRTANLRLMPAKDFSGFSQRILFETNTGDVAGAMLIHKDAADVLEFGGNTSLANSVSSHSFFASSTGEAGEKVGVGVLKIDYRGLYPYLDYKYSLGLGVKRFSQIYAQTGTIETSDERAKTSIVSPDEALMRAWGKVNFRVFQFKDAVEKKGADARLHVGVIAQQVIEAFASEGLDATRYGLLCYDKWEDEYEDVEIVDAPEIVAEDGTVTPVKTHIEHRLMTPAGDRYGIRYEEALALECAYLRWELQKIKQN